jgi:DNA repair protein RadC
MELPEMERPREKMWKQGAAALSNGELLAILISSGTRAESAVGLAARILSLRDDGLRFLSTATPEELAAIPGIGRAKSCQIGAAVELGKRLSVHTLGTKIRVGAPEDIAVLFMEEMRHETKESFRILLLNSRNEVMGREVISIGNICGSIVDPRDVFRPAVKRGAASVALVHNHPSGNPRPSEADITVTKKLVEAADILDIKVIDHLIIGDGSFVSFKLENLI